jgi:hypothetical protein
MFKRQMTRIFCVATLSVAAALPVSAAPVVWVDWETGIPGASGSAQGVLNIGSSTVNASYTGEIAFIQTAGGTNYWNPSTPYMSALVDNAPPASDIIALSTATQKTLTFSQAIDNLFFAVVSLNGNGYRFNEDFEIVSTGAGYWGDGTLTKSTAIPGQFDLIGTGEPHGVIRFTGSVSSITWTSLTNEYWNGFTVGTYGLAPPPPPVSGVPEPSTVLLLATGLLSMAAWRRMKKI